MIQSRPNIFKFILALSLSSFVSAQEIDTNQKISEDVVMPTKSRVIKVKTQALSVGPEFRNYKYSEPGFVSHEGILYGGNVEYYQSLRRPKYASEGQSVFGTAYSVGGQILIGTLNYDGALCDGLGNCEPYQAKTSDVIYRLNAKYHIQPNTRFSLQFGLGYRHLIDKGQGVGFYLRTGSWFYAPLTLEFKSPISKDMKFYLASEFDLILSGGIRSNLSEVDPNFSDVYMTQSGNGLILKTGAEFRSIRVNLIYETWTLNESNQVESGGSTFVEPKNSSQSLGVQLSYDFF